MGKFASYLFFTVTLLSFSLMVQAQEEAPSAATLYNQALEKLKAKDYNAALPLLQKAVEAADPESETDQKVLALANKNGGIAAYKAGSSLRKADKNEEALEAFKAGTELNPDFYANYIGVAQAMEGLGEDAKAVKAYLEAAEVSKKSNKPDKAEQMMSKAENMIALAYAGKEWDKTMEMAQAFLEDTETADAHYYMAQALKGKGEFSNAVEHASKAVEMADQGDTGKYYMVLAESYEALGQTSDALEAYKQIKGGKYTERAQYKINELSGGK